MGGNSTIEIPRTYIEDGKEEKISYSMDVDLRRVLDSVKSTLVQQDRDYVLVVDGSEGSGKSTLALQIGKYIDHDLDLSRIVFTAEEFRAAILKAKKGQVIVFDEAFTGLSSRTALSKVNKMLVSLMMQMRQKNLFVILVMPSFFLLDKYAAIFRSKLLVNVYENKKKRGYFRLYNNKDKRMLFLTGQRLYSYAKVKTRFGGRFYGKYALGGTKERDEYIERKAKALEDSEELEDMEYRNHIRNQIIYYIHKRFKLNAIEMGKEFMDYKIPLKQAQIYLVLRKLKEKEGIL